VKIDEHVLAQAYAAYQLRRVSEKLWASREGYMNAAAFTPVDDGTYLAGFTGGIHDASDQVRLAAEALESAVANHLGAQPPSFPHGVTLDMLDGTGESP
jgi:hypothetical protein